ncbi:MAG: hypothetical protein AB7F99_17725 [Vicinamibacterales bacterium]
MTRIRGEQQTVVGEQTWFTGKVVIQMVVYAITGAVLYGAVNARVSVVESNLSNLERVAESNRVQLEKLVETSQQGVERRLDRIETKVDQILRGAARDRER